MTLQGQIQQQEEQWLRISTAWREEKLFMQNHIRDLEDTIQSFENSTQSSNDSGNNSSSTVYTTNPTQRQGHSPDVESGEHRSSSAVVAMWRKAEQGEEKKEESGAHPWLVSLWRILG